jgi:thioredoxin reductase (NADPH)
VSRDGFVVADEKGETNVPGIFVAGDLRRKYANQIVIAAADGAVAGLAASRYVEVHASEGLQEPRENEGALCAYA